MKTTNGNRLGVFLTLLLMITSLSFAENPVEISQIEDINSRFILDGKKIIDPRTVMKIDDIGNELFEKTGISIFVHALDAYPINGFKDMKSKVEYIKRFEDGIVQKLTPPFVLLTMAVKNKHVNIITSEKIKSLIDKDNILDNFIIPLLASRDKNTPYAKVSAGILNGYAEIADSIAESKNIKLRSSIGSGNSDFTSVWKVFMYFVVITGLLLYTYAVLREKKG